MKKWKDLSTGNKIFSIIYICCWIAMGIYGFYKYNYDEKVLNNYKITTATVINFYRDSKFYNVEIEYVIKDIKYKKWIINYPDDCRLWDQYKMKYAVEDPNAIEVLWDEKIEK